MLFVMRGGWSAQQSNKEEILERPLGERWSGGALTGKKKMDGVRKGVTVGAEVSYVGGWLMIIG